MSKEKKVKDRKIDIEKGTGKSIMIYLFIYYFDN